MASARQIKLQRLQKGFGKPLKKSGKNDADKAAAKVAEEARIAAEKKAKEEAKAKAEAEAAKKKAEKEAAAKAAESKKK